MWMPQFARQRIGSPMRFRLHKGGGHSIEPRGVIARYDAERRPATVFDTTQMPHRAKSILVAALGLHENRLRVIAPDVGGGFGPKAVFHPEELAIPAAALALGAPDQMDRRQDRKFHRDRARARPGLGHGSRLRCRRAAARHTRTYAPRSRRQHALWRGASLQRRDEHDRALCVAGVPSRRFRYA